VRGYEFLSTERTPTGSDRQRTFYWAVGLIKDQAGPIFPTSLKRFGPEWIAPLGLMAQLPRSPPRPANRVCPSARNRNVFPFPSGGRPSPGPSGVDAWAKRGSPPTDPRWFQGVSTAVAQFRRAAPCRV